MLRPQELLLQLQRLAVDRLGLAQPPQRHQHLHTMHHGGERRGFGVEGLKAWTVQGRGIKKLLPQSKEGQDTEVF